MILDQMKPGVKILYHGGWDGTKTERCPGCNFQCAYIIAGVVTERYKIWNPTSESYVLHPDHWTAQLETGSYVTGDLEQFELVV
jgi:hypothetical protein